MALTPKVRSKPATGAMMAQMKLPANQTPSTGNANRMTNPFAK
ncbi:hypothetical protein NYE24_30455 [Paenibacillus sp. FSL H7-0350]